MKNTWTAKPTPIAKNTRTVDALGAWAKLVDTAAAIIAAPAIPIAVPKKPASAKKLDAWACPIPYAPEPLVESTLIAKANNAVCRPITMAARHRFLSRVAPKTMLANPMEIAVLQANALSFDREPMRAGNAVGAHASLVVPSSSTAKFTPRK